MTGPVVVRSGDDWEILNDDGLIYKRQKRERHLSSEVLEPPVLPQVDKHWRRNRKKAALKQLKCRYLAEIEEWEKLFQKLENPSENKALHKEFSDSTISENSIVDLSEQKFKNTVEKLSYQVIQLEKFMEDLRILCSDVECICKLPDDYREFIKSPRILVNNLSASTEVPCFSPEEQHKL
ncbi:hypothetical protein L7F22_033978 [Adiantum nelumboides]|nr:hypothetical protein [Adiantum nelumboides]